MAWLRKIPRSPYWQAIIYLPDGRKTTKSTGTTKKRDAQQIADQFEQASGVGKSGKLTERLARGTISHIFAIANQDKLEASTTEDYLHNWLKRKQIESSEATADRYASLVQRFLTRIGAKAKRDIMHLNSKDISKARDEVSKKLTPSTANMMVKVIRTALNQALRDGFIDTNEANKVTLIKRHEKANRRPFSQREIRRLLKAADFEWQGIILCGLYTGQRLTDIALLTWENLDLVNENLNFHTRKTNRSMALPLAKQLKEYFDKIPAGDDPKAPLFPTAYARRIRNNNAGPLSNQFNKVMVKAGLAEHKSHQSTGKGRTSKRKLNELSFHCLRHTATSMLKNAGVSDAVARDIIGHDSEAISRQYTHIDLAAKRKAIEALPDLFE